MNNLSFFAILVFSFCLCQIDVGATICKPLSPFKIDCDDCRCSENGKEYTCYAGSCGKLPFEDDDSYLPRKAYPYNLDNEVPLNDDDYLNKLGYDVNSLDEDKLFDLGPNELTNDASLEEQDASNIDSGDLEDFRYKRHAKPLGLQAH